MCSCSLAPLGQISTVRIMTTRQSRHSPSLPGRLGIKVLLLAGLALIFSGALLPGSVLANGPKDSSSPEEAFSSSAVCGRCHIDIYDHWRNSLHARSMEDPIFRTAYYEAYTTSGGEAKFLCLKCHAPTTQITKDFDMKTEITKEGVTCDYCHSITALAPKDRAGPYEVEVGPTKRGPWKDAKSPAHKSAYSPLFESATFCSGCHEFTNEHGLRVLETYSEWERSPYAKEGITCQNCHMPRVKGLKAVAGTGSSARGYANLHKLAGGSSLGQLQRALGLDITSIKRQDGDILVDVAITNQGAGHMVPTGLPGRAIVLEVALRSGGNNLQSQNQSYKKILLDGDGNEIDKVSMLFGAHSIAQDNRIAPRETRKERFRFAVHPSERAEVSAKVFYIYEPHLVEKKQIRVEVIGKDRVAPITEGGGR